MTEVQNDQGVATTSETKGANMRNFWAVIPAGGAGTRLWPASRSFKPKFLLPLLGDQSLLQQTVARLEPLAPADRTLIVCGPAHAAAVGEQLPDVPADNIVVEPAPRGSGPAIALAAALIAQRDPTAVMGSFAADHAVTDEAAFRAAVRTACAAADAGWLTTIGLTPTYPEVGYGYIERTEEPVAEIEDGIAYRAERFVEKPDLGTAVGYLATGRYVWNASMFIWSVETFLEELAGLQPELHTAVLRIAAAWDTPDRDAVVSEAWTALAESTIDQGVMERTAKVATVPASIGWSDVGDWHGLATLMAGAGQEQTQQTVDGTIARLDSTHSVVWSNTGRLVALVGIEDAVVVDTPDALLVVDRKRSQDIKSLVDALKRSEHKQLL